MSQQNPLVLTPFPRWLLPAGGVLAVIGGAINVICILGFARQPVTHMTGLVSGIGIATATLDGATLVAMLALLTAFVLGAMTGGAIAREQTLIAGRRYAVGLALEAMMLAAAVPLLSAGSMLGIYFVAFAGSLQNALVSTFSGALLRTNHVTGMLTDLGIYLAHTLMRRPVVAIRLRINAIVVMCFLLGGVLGTLAFGAMGYATLYVAAAGIALFAIACYINRMVDLRLGLGEPGT